MSRGSCRIVKSRSYYHKAGHKNAEYRRSAYDKEVLEHEVRVKLKTPTASAGTDKSALAAGSSIQNVGELPVPVPVQVQAGASVLDGANGATGSGLGDRELSTGSRQRIVLAKISHTRAQIFKATVST